MTASTGRSTSNYTIVYIDDSAGTLRSIAINSIGGVGLEYEEKDVTAWYDAIRGVLLGQPSFSTTISGPVDTTADTGNHPVLSGVVGKNVPLAFDVRLGVRHVWEAGEPVFGITATAANGVLVKSYKIDPESMTYTAEIVMAAGSAAPDWATAAHT